ncbi:uncharacterized protein RSE6_08512 [Rhynchosporium secalis]|uniref:Uncharacterized protein n=1 Tax=Rhynchosporium secalis TaxID=38038 RepID=A0A1E1MFM0_RHYSE|nr:uncharacterized protein RSE6_08512 [Rhynchosporium secalis]
MLVPSLIATALLVRSITAQEIVNGQISTPGIAIIDSPQPNTPLGGDTLHIAIDISSNGQLQLPPYPDNAPSSIHNITLFLTSYTTGKNFTITNGTSSAGGDIMKQEPGSTVKHVNWVWPDCFVADGAHVNNDAAKGIYNISIHQNFRLNGTDLYTIFDLPIRITNSISSTSSRPSCDSLTNPLLDQASLNASANSFTRIPGTPIQGGGKDGTSGAGMVDWRTSGHWVWMGVFVLVVCI